MAYQKHFPAQTRPSTKSRFQNWATQAFELDRQNPHFKSGQAAFRHSMDGEPPIGLEPLARAHWRAGYRFASGGFS